MHDTWELYKFYVAKFYLRTTDTEIVMTSSLIDGGFPINLNNSPYRRLGRDGPISWSPRAPDLTSLDFSCGDMWKTEYYPWPCQRFESLERENTQSFIVCDYGNEAIDVAGIWTPTLQLVLWNCDGHVGLYILRSTEPFIME